MFETWSEPTRRVIFFARYEASKLGASKVQATHLILGLLREAKAIFFKLKIPPGKLVMIQAACIKAGTGTTPTAISVDMALDKDAVVILKRASEEMRKRKHRKIGAEHLLLAALHVPSKARSILRRQGLTYQQVGTILFRPRVDGSQGSVVDYT